MIVGVKKFWFEQSWCNESTCKRLPFWLIEGHTCRQSKASGVVFRRLKSNSWKPPAYTDRHLGSSMWKTTDLLIRHTSNETHERSQVWVSDTPKVKHVKDSNFDRYLWSYVRKASALIIQPTCNQTRERSQLWSAGTCEQTCEKF